MLPKYIEENLKACSKEQLIFLIDKYWNSLRSIGSIGKICVDESKIHISSVNAVDEIRDNLIDFPFSSNLKDFLAFIDYKMGKIKMSEYRKRLGLDD